ncbi:MAG: hypothetical protein HYT71_01250 [Candidatus Aenigmarchaeota archaeon]|nr:hypothetical protein [Candidatus Aenigmarchaeota archaeon]
MSLRLLMKVLSICPNLESITISKYAYGRASFNALQAPGIRFFISGRKAGRPIGEGLIKCAAKTVIG